MSDLITKRTSKLKTPRMLNLILPSCLHGDGCRLGEGMEPLLQGGQGLLDDHTLRHLLLLDLPFPPTKIYPVNTVFLEGLEQVQDCACGGVLTAHQDVTSD